MIRKHGSRASRMILMMCLIFSLVLPNSALAQDTGEVQVTGGGTGHLEVELLPGVQVTHGKLLVTRMDYVLSNEIDVTNGNQFNLSTLSIDPSSPYLIQLQMDYIDAASGSTLAYYDDQEILGRDLLALSHWNLDANRKFIQPDKLAFTKDSNAKITYVIQHPLSARQPYKLDLSSTGALITSPRTIESQLTESTNNIGFHLQKAFTTDELISVSDAVYYNFNHEKNTAASLSLPATVTSIQINSMDHQHMSGFDPQLVNEIKLTGGRQSITLTTPTISTWGLYRDIKSGEKLTFTGAPTRVMISKLNYDPYYKALNFKPATFSGDFKFYDSYSSHPLYQVKLFRDNKELPLSNVEISFQGDVTLRTVDPLTSGNYTTEVTLNMNGTTVQATSDILKLQIRDSEIGGLPVTVQNENGQPLLNGTIQLFEKQIFDANNQDVLASVFHNKIQNGSSFIPHAYLLEGKQYQLLVQGESEDGSPVIYHRTFIAGHEGELTFTSKQLKELNIIPNKQITADIEHIGISLQDEQGYHLTSTLTFSRNKNDQNKSISRFLIATEAQFADLQFHFYNSAQDKGYYDRRHQFKLMNNSMSVNPFNNLAEFTLPSGLQGTISIDDAMTDTQMNASKYYIQKGSLVSVDYTVEKNGYRYFFYGYYDVSANEQLPEKISLQGEIFRHVGYENRVIILYRNLKSNLNLSYIENIRTNQTIYAADSQPEMRIAPTEALEYQLYNQQGNKLGESVRSDLYGFILNTNVTKGALYRVKLVNQLMPKDMIELSLDDTFIADQGHGKLKEIPIQGPNGERILNDRETRSEIWEMKNDDGYEYINASYLASIENQKLIIPLGIQRDKNYIVHLVAYLSGGSLYYKNFAVTGEELLQMQEIPASPHLIKYKQTNPIAAETFFYRLQIPGSDMKFVIMDKTELLTDISDLDVVQIKSDGSNAYDLRKSLHSNGAREVLFSMDDEQKNIVPITIQKNQSQTSFIAFYDWMEGIYYGVDYSSSKPSTIQTLFTNPGLRRYGFVTLESRPNETPWAYTWEQRDPVNIQEKMELHLPDKINKSFDEFRVSKNPKNEYTINSLVHLTSGELKLTSLGVYRERKFSFSAARALDGPAVSIIKPYDGKFDDINKVYPTITVKDRSGNVIVKQENNEYLDFFNITLPSDIKPGNYSLTYQLPTGPRESLELSKTFEIPHPNTNPGGGDNGGSPGTGTGGGNNGGNPGGGGAPALPGGAVPAKPNVNQENKDIVDITSANVPQAVNGKVEINVSSKNVTQIQLPGIIAGAIGNNTLVIRTPNGDIEIPSTVLKELAGLVNTADAKDAKVKVTFKPVTQEAATTLLKPWQSQMAQAGQIVELELSITSNGKELPLEQFSTPIKVVLNVTDASDRELIGIYGMDGGNRPAYVGGKLNGDKLVAELARSGKYGVLKFNKTFSDVPASHWAYQAIRDLTAKQIAKGLTVDQFAPSREITRAEFVQFLVNALHLTSSTTPTFNDVPAASWYADAVAAGVEHGLVRGLSSEQFGPNQAITREEMAVIVTKAYQNMTKQELQAAAAASFSDRSQASSWAQSAIDQAVTIQLLQGKDEQTFAPKQHATRAEAAKVILNLLAKK